MSPSTRFSFATSGWPCGDPVHGTGPSADIERDLCKEPKVTKLARDNTTYLIHASNAGIRGGGWVDAMPKAPRSRTSSMSANAGSPLKTMQLALPELDAAARTSPTDGKKVRLNTPKDAIFPSSDLNTTMDPLPEKKTESLDSIIDDHLASRGYGSSSVVYHRLDKKRTSTVVHYPMTSTYYVTKHDAPPAALWAKDEAKRSKNGVVSKTRTGEAAPKIEDDWQEVDKDDEEWTMV